MPDQTSNGMFDGSQFAQSMDGQATIDNQVQQNQFATSVDQVFAEAKFDGNVNNTISNEFVQSTPTFTGYNADPNVIAQNNMVPS